MLANSFASFLILIRATETNRTNDDFKIVCSFSRISIYHLPANVNGHFRLPTKCRRTAWKANDFIMIYFSGCIELTRFRLNQLDEFQFLTSAIVFQWHGFCLMNLFSKSSFITIIRYDQISFYCTG